MVTAVCFPLANTGKYSKIQADMIKAILFDMDGILFDSEPWYMNGTIEWMREYGYTGDEESVWKILGTTMDETYSILYELLGGSVEREELIRRNERYFGIEHPVKPVDLVFPGVPETVRRIHDEGFLTAVCSSSPRDTIYEVLDSIGITDCYDVILSGDEKFPPKPAPDIYLTAAEKLGVLPEECIVYEDSCRGITAGKQAGMTVIARRDDRFRQDQSGADHIVKDIYEMASILSEGEHICRKSSESAAEDR